ncbi:HD-GYP domain-containing protein (c-di-GMP phosphodiesterase class II) [Anaerosolibacter carboniphilus]|uniref:HD-GYP domain-containing protein (C-di-GMP phosphodiesterase class II) n=1 Tax=Anaerosolibacter carboniphilus TaxID=1417629 RepID=A0A841KWW3_9FIRM|nr:HD-GYP domain-containing protein [Anaerosolibacter carboniphilus]MBB6216738.1 HD-GYP domain-containing protein (c-di-GMP phosphodiesterase class II) [Anaerosolibacter carboniphilus]
MRLIPVNCIKEGSTLAQALYDKDGRILLHKGVELNDGLLKKVEDSGISMIYINDEYSSNEIEDIIEPKVRIAAINALRETFTSFERNNQQLKGKTNSLKERQLLKQRDDYFHNLNSLTKNIVDEISSAKSVLVSLVDIKSMDNYTYEHSVNVAVLSLVLGTELRLSKNDLYDLAIGAMLHDIGKAFIPKDILLKKDPLTDEEYAIAKEHTTRGYSYLKELYSIPGPARIIALQHHEKVDGTGYPGGLTGNKISKLAKIIAITDTYDAMTSDKPYKKAVAPQEAIEYIMGSAGTHFDFEMAQTFVRKVVPYPVGTLVRLSNGDYGVVEKVVPNFPLRPTVKVIRQTAVSIKMVEIDLLKETNLVIEGIQYETPDLSVQTYLKKK